MTHLLFLLHVGSTLYMMGLIWFVQVVHYPLHAHVGAEQFSNYQHLHMNWTTFVVGPPMLIEMATTVWFLLEPPLNIPNSYFYFQNLSLHSTFFHKMIFKSSCESSSRKNDVNFILPN